MDNESQEPSPFKIYEEKYCNKCADYRGCIGLIDLMSMEMQDSKKSGNEAFDSAMKNVGTMTFTTRFKLILDCSNMRNYLNNCCAREYNESVAYGTLRGIK